MAMLLVNCILIILFEAVGEGLIKRYNLFDFLFKWWVQWLIAIGLFALWLLYALQFDNYDVPVWKLITGFIGVRFMIFDVAYNLANKQKWNYYGTVKLYDRIMTKTGSWGWFIKIICGIIGICFLMGWK